MTTEIIRKKLIELHDQEDTMNKSMGNIDKQVLELKKQKKKLAKKISNNMKYRNQLIYKL